MKKNEKRGRVARIEEMRNACNILKWILSVRMWIRFRWLRMGSSDRSRGFLYQLSNLL